MDRPCLEMGSRRAHEEAAVAAARAAVVAGFAGTSNLEAGRRYGLPTIGTAAHAFTLLHDDEAAAFAAQVASLGTGTTLLVDTYDVRRGVELALAAAGTGLGAVRLDSGDLGVLAHEVRAQLDEAGAQGTKITVTSDLDEYAIASLAVAPVDSYGVGTSVVTGSGAPTCGMVYKLVAREGADGALAPVAKAARGKISVGGRKAAARRLGRRRPGGRGGARHGARRRRPRPGRPPTRRCAPCTSRSSPTARSTPAGRVRTACAGQQNGTAPRGTSCRAGRGGCLPTRQRCRPWRCGSGTEGPEPQRRYCECVRLELDARAAPADQPEDQADDEHDDADPDEELADVRSRRQG